MRVPNPLVVAGESDRGRPVDAAQGTRGLRLGIDASNLRRGGGVTHLIEILRNAHPQEAGFDTVVVWGGEETLEQLEPRPWLELVHCPELERSLPLRVLWQMTRLAPEARRRCDLLFAPGGRYTGTFRPLVTMSRNLLPFDQAARRRYRGSMRLHLELLKRIQTRSLRAADGVIFLTTTARRVVEQTTGPVRGQITVIPHGISHRFHRPPRPQRPLSAYSQERPFRWLYISTIDRYKHQQEVSEAALVLRRRGLPVELTLVGPASSHALLELRKTLARLDPEADFLKYRGSVPYGELPHLYHSADGFVFASSCENLPNILLEAMAAGLPIACSARSVMPEVLGEAGLYFDPEDSGSIARAMHSSMNDLEQRRRLAKMAHQQAQGYSWSRCSRDTFAFLASVAATRQLERSEGQR